MFCPRTVIGENKTQVFMVCGFIYHCIVHEEGRVNNWVCLREKITESVLLALNATSKVFAQSEIVFR